MLKFGLFFFSSGGEKALTIVKIDKCEIEHEIDKDEYWISSFVKLNDNFTLIGSGNCK